MGKRTLLNDGWQFAEVPLDTPYEAVPAEAFQEVRLPHDFLITDTAGLYRDATGWYRRTITIPPREENAPKRLQLYFDGVYMDSTIFLNGRKIGEWKYGYSSFLIDLTEHLLWGEDNEIRVSVRHQSPNTRWYSGAGIFRNVFLVEKSLTHIPENGVYFHAFPVKNGYSWEMVVRTEVEGEHAADVEIVHRLFDTEGRETALTPVFQAELITEAPFIQGSSDLSQDKGAPLLSLLSGVKAVMPKRRIRCVEKRYLVNNVCCWDISNPFLYTLQTSLQLDHIEVDRSVSRVGFRSITMDPRQGLFLNGRSLKLNGVCEHHDLGALGAAFHRPAFRRKLRKLREMGVNAIRFSHNMAAEEALDLADEMGFLVISEAFDMWERSKTTYDYARFFRKWHTRDVERWVRRDRNHPCVFLWSIGNEIYDTHADARGLKITRELTAQVHRLDPMRNGLVTSGSNYMPWEGAQRCADALDVVGYNYDEKLYREHHEKHPDWIIYGSETCSIVQSRGVYHFPLGTGSLAEEDEQCSALGNSCTSWGAHSFEECAGIDRDLPFSLGQFLWTGFDYIGEPTPYHTKNSYFGQIDTAGFPKDMYYFWASVWTDPAVDPMVHIIPSSWDFNPGQLIDVRVVSNLNRVELFLNDRSLGKKELTHKPGSGLTLFADYQVPYEPGELSAVAFDDDGCEVDRDILRSFGDTCAYTVDREPFEPEDDILFYDIAAVDENRVFVMNASDLVRITVRGPGRLIGTDNGDSTDTDSYQSAERRLFNGRLLAIVQADPGADKEAIDVSVERVSDMIPVRSLEIVPDEGQLFTADNTTFRARVLIHPADATDQKIESRLVNNTGVTSNLAEIFSMILTDDGEYTVIMTARGDGDFRLRAVSKSGTDSPRVLSELEYRVEGVGQAYIDPYEFVSASLYTSCIGGVGSGNEKGIASAREEDTVITWEGLDFGVDYADRITIPIFTLNDDPYMIQIWRGIPWDDDAELLVDGVYQKKSIWNVYQEESWDLKKRLTGLQTISIRVNKKFHIKGFVFHRIDRAFAEIPVTEAETIYGDQYEKREDAVYSIGNNVTISFGELDFGENDADAVILTGRGKQANSVHLCLTDDTGKEIRQLIEFPASPDFTPKRFSLKELPGGRVTGKKKLSFVFLPGTVFDFRSFRFISD